MKIAITGANGFIGRHLVPALKAEGHTPVCLNRDDFAGGDAAAVMRCAGADALVHLAGRAHKSGETAASHQALYHEDNVALTRRVLDIARQAGIPRVVFLSTIGVFGQSGRDLPLGEDDAPNADTPYALSKLQAEQEVMAFCDLHDIAWTILRPPLVYGPDAPGNIGLLRKLIRTGLPLPFGAIRNRRSLIGVANLCNVVAACLESEKSHRQVYNLSDGVDRSTPELLRLLAGMERRAARLFPLPLALLKFGGAVTGQSKRLAPLWQDYRVDSAKLETQLGWQAKR